LSLAYRLAQSGVAAGREASMLIIDHDAKRRNDRTWCFWTPVERPTPFDSLVSREWRQLKVAGPEWQKTIGLRHHRYQMIRGIDFYRFVRQQLAARPKVTFLQATVEGIDDHGPQAGVTADGTRYAGRWVFDSRFNPARFQPAPARYLALRQHFKGWLIEAPRPVFDPAVPTLMDFRTPQRGGLRFFYVLPLTARRALVELVALSPRLADDALHAYIQSSLGLDEYRILAREGGVSPLTDYPFPRCPSPHVLRIGAAGGRVKPTTGYAFTRVQQDSAAIVRSLEQHGHPFDLHAGSAYYRMCDTLMLDLMRQRSDQMPGLFKALFRNNPIERVLRFLDENASPAENAQLIASLPPGPFLQALGRMPGRAAWAQLAAGGASPENRTLS
jgi:lycopene beta-cyclase